MDELLATLKKDIDQEKNNGINSNMTILIKGSRSMKMERAVEALAFKESA